MGIELPQGMDTAEAWKGGTLLPLGWHRVKIAEAEEGTSSNNNPELHFRFVGRAGDIQDWLQITQNTIGKVAQFMDAVEIDRMAVKSLEASACEGRELDVFVAEEPDRSDPNKRRRRVKVYATAGSESGDSQPIGSGAAASGNGQGNADLPF